MWMLLLNPVTARAEYRESLYCAETREALVAFVERERAPEPYEDEGYTKVFKKGSPLEYFNHPDEHEGPRLGDFRYIGTVEDWKIAAAHKYESMLQRLNRVSETGEIKTHE